ncbi:MAG: methylenetetrahydrofolate--tRNA-(uracil(54)-C(5))-methyltransferase (FADH(2)-oxidizing) TrmFO [Candidatus Sericytochromatia bacterium]|nr:methylenetetrahydrofolate--tRNA-(uracil(54)-C(5))-methyltransferase (FADH(2)-oxidizing) TrmFO [Candidatus Tanganyikabacteria bacterium]
MRAHVVGGGLAGSEAAWQLARAGVDVTLCEMRPAASTPAHRTDQLAELVCSNSLGSDTPGSAPALLKAEMRRFGSLVLEAAEAARVPAGSALAVDRDIFAANVTRRLAEHPRIAVVRAEIGELPDPAVVATGPLTSPGFAATLQREIGAAHLHFFDAAAPVVTRESLDEAKLFAASRYGKGDGVYLNAPLTRDEYEAFHAALCAAENTVLHLAEEQDVRFFEGCLPVEVLARRGHDTLRYGPMKPVGLRDPRTGHRPHAVVQLRQDNVAGDLFNLVGFQTQLKWGEQKRVFSLIPGLEQAEFVRLGVMHKNTYLAAPAFLAPTLAHRERPGWFFAGTLIGVEGYTEAAATGLLAGFNLARTLRGDAPLELPTTTMLGALARYVSTCEVKHFQPINSNWGIVDPLASRVRDKQERHRLQHERSLADLDRLLAGSGVLASG